MHILLTTGLMASSLLVSALTANLSTVVPELEIIEEEPKVQEIHSVALTGYNAVPEQTDESPFTTSIGVYSNPEIIIARSVDLAGELPYGTVVEIVVPEDGTENPCGLSKVEHLVGLRVVADSMHSRKRNQLDILFDSNSTVKIGGKKTNPAVVLGVCKEIEIRVIGKIDVKKMPRNQTELMARVGVATLAIK